MNHSEMMEEGHNPMQCKGGILKNVPKVRSQETNNMIVKKMGREKTTCQKRDLSKELILPLGFQMETGHIMKRIIIFNS